MVNTAPRSRVELRIDIPGTLHRRLKVMAAERDTPLRDLIIELLEKTSAKEGG